MFSSSSSEQDKTTVKEAPILLLKGFLMGTADVIPGVSGGTIALITGIYQRLIAAINSANVHVAKALLRFDFRAALTAFHWKFLMVLLSGIISALLFFTRVVPLQKFMFSHPEIVYGLFFGLIAGSIVLLYASVKPINGPILGFLGLGTAIGYFIVTLVPTETPETWWFTFISGAIAITAMILPGISGSFILLILRKYSYILSQVEKLGSDETVEAVIVLVWFVAGLVVGILAFSRVLSWLLNRYARPTLAVLTGFMLGSLIVIWPFQHRTFEETERTKWVTPTEAQSIPLVTTDQQSVLPEYKKRGETREDGTQAIITVKKKLLHSKPYFPDRTRNTPAEMMSAVLSMLLGLAAVWGLGKMAK